MLVCAAVMGVMGCMAQMVTYNHDAAKMNQILVMETGERCLTPEFYY